MIEKNGKLKRGPVHPLRRATNHLGSWKAQQQYGCLSVPEMSVGLSEELIEVDPSIFNDRTELFPGIRHVPMIPYWLRRQTNPDRNFLLLDHRDLRSPVWRSNFVAPK
jgi:hypothetical protein